MTLNPHRRAAAARSCTATTTTIRSSMQRAIAAQQELWSLQGQRNTWFCGAYFGAGFHEDGLQAGLAVAEALGGGAGRGRVAGRIRPHRPPRRPDRPAHARRRHELPLRPLCRLGDAPAAPAAAASTALPALLDADRSRRTRPRSAKALRLFSRNRFNLFSFHDARLMATARLTPLAPRRSSGKLAAAGIGDAGGPHPSSSAMPRIFGYAFNPHQRLFLPRPDGALRADRLRGPQHLRRAPQLPVLGRRRRGRSRPQPAHRDKAFHVSPFIGMAMRYAFRVEPAGRARIASRSRARMPTDL